MRIVSLGYIMRDDWATDSPLSILVKKVLAFINIERKFLSVDVQKEVVEIFSDMTAHLGKRN